MHAHTRTHAPHTTHTRGRSHAHTHTHAAHTHAHRYGTGHGVYLTPSGDLIRLEDDSAMGVGASISIPGDASLISVYDWEGVALFTKVVNNATHRLHHQIDPHTFDVRSGTGTLFALTAYRLECDVARGLGRLVCDDEAGMYVEAVLEIDTSGAVVWEWYLSNHVCAVDCAADVSRVDINSGEGHAKADWVHANSLVYDAEHDVLLLGGAYTREVYVIDHSAPSETPLMAGVSAATALGRCVIACARARARRQRSTPRRNDACLDAHV